MNELGAAAVDYVRRRGWHVFPCAPRGKTPITQHGLKDASNDPGLVAARWAETPLANIGCACGPSNLLVVDADSAFAVRAWGELVARNGGLPRTLTARTGNGYHFLFAGNGPSSASRIGPKLDTRSAGAYIILTPSVHPSGVAYRWVNPDADPLPAPGWLLELLAKGPPAAVGERRELPAGVVSTRYGFAALQAMAAEMARTVEGHRNATLNALSYRCGRLSAAGQLAKAAACEDMVGAAVFAGLIRGEAEATFASGFNAGLERPASLEPRP